MEFQSRYKAHQPDEQGLIPYTEQDHQVWKKLFDRQSKVVTHFACQEFLDGIERLGLTHSHIPQLGDINQKLAQLTKWEVVPVPALISARKFFELLANRQFPAATFIRHIEELDYVQEPDIFHEIFGHCPMLTHPVYANFMENFAKIVLQFPEEDWPLLQRLFWFTVEFGLIQTSQGIRAYGGGILSSISETGYSVESHLALRVLFHPVPAFRTPYRIDILQPIYYVIPDFPTLFQLINIDLKKDMQDAKTLGEFHPMFPVEPNNPAIHIFAC